MRSDSATQFVFLRHGESTGNAEKRHQGQADYPLTDLGKDQAEQLAVYWKKQGMVFDKAISSPLKRAKETANIIKSYLPLDLAYSPIWMERDNGKLAGLRWEEALEIYPPPPFTPLYQPIAETGESLWDLFIRASNALNNLMDLPPGNYLIISHGGLLNMVMHAIIGIHPQANFQGPRFRFSNTGHTTVQYLIKRNIWNISKHNDTSHLK
jgi:2,3-bisphosphoglycerate-dependent phosphoglycerate mutase